MFQFDWTNRSARAVIIAKAATGNFEDKMTDDDPCKQIG
jgi:hypothetical protein